MFQTTLTRANIFLFLYNQETLGVTMLKENATFSILKSDGVLVDKAQEEHVDVDLDMVRENAYEEGKPIKSELPLLCLLAFEDFTHFNFYEGSHTGLIDNLGMRRNNFPKRIVLMRGEFVIFHPLLVHFGGRYDMPNCRMHLYSMTAKIPLAYEGNDILTYSVNNIQSCGQTKQELSNQLKNGKRKKKESKDKRVENLQNSKK